LFVTAGDPRRATGGNIYAGRMLAAIRRSGVRVDVLRLDGTRRLRDLRETSARAVLVDTLAADDVAPHLDGLRRRGVRVMTLALMERGAATLGRASQRVIAVSRALAHDIASDGVPRSRIRVVAPGVDRPAATRRATPRPGPVRALCVANWTKEKGIRTVLAAIEWLPDVELDLVGDAPDRGYAARIRADLRRAAFKRRVRAHGVVRGERLRRMYERADLFVLPSTRESWGIAVAEALAAGLPVIACDIPATREVTRGAAVLVPPGRVDPLSDAIARVASDPARRERMSRRARERARRLPSWSESEHRFVRELREIMRDGSRR
jgi:glycosyltransferase involved in cell wall biosynthesis